MKVMSLALAACVGTLISGHASAANISFDFEGPAYASGDWALSPAGGTPATIAGQNGWVRKFFGSNNELVRVVAGTNPNSPGDSALAGNQSLLTGNTGDYLIGHDISGQTFQDGTTFSYLHKVIAENPSPQSSWVAIGNGDLNAGQTNMNVRIIGGQVEAYAAIAPMAGTAGWVTLGAATPGVHQFDMVMNFTAQTYSVFVDGVQLGSPVLMELGGVLLSQGGDSVLDPSDLATASLYIATFGSANQLFDNLQFSQVPEPSAATMLGIGLVGMMRRWRRR